MRWPASMRIGLSGLLSGAVIVARPSEAQEPSTADCLSASTAWINLRKEEKLLGARAQLLTCAAASCPGEVRDECLRHISETNAAIPSIVFAVQDSAGNDMTAVVVTMDSQPLADKLDGSAIALDPGEHAFRFETAGLVPVEKRFVIREGEKGRRETIELGVRLQPLPVAPGLPIETPQGLSPPPDVAKRDTAARSGLRGQKLLGLSFGVLGIGGLATGVVTGLIAESDWSSAQKRCPKGSPCASDSPAQAKKTDALSAATVSDIAFVAGGALLASGVVLFLSAPSGSSLASFHLVPSVGTSGGELLLRSEF